MEEKGLIYVTGNAQPLRDKPLITT